VLKRRERPGTVGRIYANLSRLLAGKAMAGLLSLAYLAVAARALGPRDYGVLVLVHGYVMAVAGIIEFPGWHAIVRYGAQAIEAGDSERLARLLRFAGLVEGVAGAIAVAAAALLAPLVGPHLGWPPEALAFAAPYSFAVLATVRSTPAGYLQLAGRFDLLGLHNVVAPVVRLLGALAVVALGGGLRGFLIAWLAAALAEFATLWLLGGWVASRRIGGATLMGGLRGVVGDNPGLWRFMWAANADVTFGELSARIAPLIIGWVLGPAATGLFAVAQRASVVISQPGQILGQSAYAEFARLVAAGQRGLRLRQALWRSVGYAFLAVGPVLFLVALFGGQLAALLGGRAFVAAGGLMFWLALARAILLMAPPTGAALTALGRPGLSLRANLIAGVGTLALLPLLLQGLGLRGGAAQALLQALTAAALLSIFFWRQSREAAAAEALAR
jgi:O-antigen/teichoic acid export membrane protein